MKTPKSPKAGDYTDEFIVKTVKLRGSEYTFRELDVARYDELVQLATSKNDQDEEMVDNALLSKLMAAATCIDPRLPDGLAGLPMRLANKIQMVAREVNYGTEPEETDDKKEPDVQEGDPDETEGEG